jgi:GTPase SAR1 family protein
MDDQKNDQNNAESFKVVLMGESGVGKTSILNRFTKDMFKENIMSTAGVTFISKILEYPDLKKNCKLDVNIYNIYNKF